MAFAKEYRMLCEKYGVIVREDCHGAWACWFSNEEELNDHIHGVENY